MQAQWIWLQKNAAADEYAEFYTDFDYVGGECILRICADSAFAIYVNGEPAGFGKYPDYPRRRILDERDLTPFLRAGKNRLAIVVWYIGIGCLNYCEGEAGLYFEVEAEGETVACSNAFTKGRLSKAYVSHQPKMITPQLGFSFAYDARKEDGWKVGDETEGFEGCRELSLPLEFSPRPIDLLRLGAPIRGEIVQQGYFLEKDYPTVGERMQRAALGFIPAAEAFGERRISYRLDRPIEIGTAEGNGCYILVDLGAESVGFLDLDFSVEEDCYVEIGYGEHLLDGRPRTHIGVRSFSAEYHAKAGENKYVNYFRRLGGRYLIFFFHTKEKITVRAAGLRPVDYPMRKKTIMFSNTLHQAVYDVCVRTLEVCMHDHYEDTPWREQSFYTTDSRAQILCGYVAFEDEDVRKYVLAGLRLFAQALRKDGLLDLCAPAGTQCGEPIPFFSLMYIVTVAEYCAQTGDYTFAEEVYPVMERILNTIRNQLRANGVIENFAKQGVWDFYEWTDGLDGAEKIPSFDAPLNGYFLYAIQKFIKIDEALGRASSANAWSVVEKQVKAGCRKLFYQPERGLFKSFEGRADHFCELTNALFLLTGVAEGDIAERLCDKLLQKENGMVKISLSHAIFKYDALLTVNKEKYGSLILKEIEEKYLYMLRQGATTFWETELGAADFYGAGSLSHGWTAIPIYLFKKLGLI